MILNRRLLLGLTSLIEVLWLLPLFGERSRRGPWRRDFIDHQVITPKATASGIETLPECDERRTDPMASQRRQLLKRGLLMPRLWNIDQVAVEEVEPEEHVGDHVERASPATG